jgi:hypothetical protein
VNAVEMLMPDGARSGLWLCGKCHHLSAWNGTPALFPTDPGVTADQREKNSAWMREHAERCCRPTTCRDCGEPTGKQYYSVCPACMRRSEEEKERALFQKAAKLTVAEWAADAGGGWLYDGRADKLFRDPDEAEEWYADDPGRTRPAHLWCTTPIAWKPDASGWLADAMHDRYHEGAVDGIDAAEWKRLDELVLRWWEEQGVEGFDVDHTRCVVLDAAGGKDGAA